jgi:Head domain of trimeric autotransporter adhesin
MKKLLFFILIYFWITAHLHAQVGKVGINTTTPSAMLHVKDSSVVFTGLNSLPIPAGKPPVSGSGIRMMWYPDKAAFRSGQVINNWDKDSIGLYSVAMGFNSKAKGDASAAIGNATSATGFSSTAFGSGNIASANSSLAMGVATIASGIQSVSMGESTKAKSYASLVIGQFNETSNMLSPDFWDSNDPVFVIGNGNIFTSARF